MAEITAEQIADALIERHAKLVKTCFFTVEHGGLDGYDRNEQLAQFMTRLRTAGLAAAHRSGWPRPEAVTKAEVAIVAHGKRCGPKTLAHLSAFLGKYFYVGAVVFGSPTIVKAGSPRLQITVRALEIIIPENAADVAARRAREAPSPGIRADGTYENELRTYETPAFILDQGVAEVDPLDERLNRMETAVQIPTAEDDADPPSIRNAEDPDAVIKRWGPILAHETAGGGSSNNKGPKPKPKAVSRIGTYDVILSDDGRGEDELARARRMVALNAERVNNAKAPGRPLKGREPRMRVQARLEPSTVIDLNEHTGRNAGEILEEFHKLVMMASSGAAAVDLGAAVIAMLEDSGERKSA